MLRIFCFARWGMLHIMGRPRYRLAYMQIRAQSACDDTRQVRYVTEITKIASLIDTAPTLGLKINDNPPSPLLTHKARIPICPE